jgi:hypothetical protein
MILRLVPPDKELLTSYFKLREKGGLNFSVDFLLLFKQHHQAKYSVRLQEFHRLTFLIKSFQQDVKQKAASYL